MVEWFWSEWILYIGIWMGRFILNMETWMGRFRKQQSLLTGSLSVRVPLCNERLKSVSWTIVNDRSYHGSRNQKRGWVVHWPFQQVTRSKARLGGALTIPAGHEIENEIGWCFDHSGRSQDQKRGWGVCKNSQVCRDFVACTLANVPKPVSYTHLTLPTSDGV